MISLKQGFTHSFVFIVYILLDSICQISAKRCEYYSWGSPDASRSVHIFHCRIFENCCGRGCCRAFQNLSFYQIWYFWMVMILLFLLCCGGGCWARNRRYGQVIRTMPTVTATTTAPSAQQSSGARTNPTGAPVLYPFGSFGQYPVYGTVVLNDSGDPSPVLTAQATVPAPVLPPYTGPPPSYETIYKVTPHPMPSEPQ